VFNFDEEYDENERKYEQIRKIILDKTGDDEYESNSNQQILMKKIVKLIQQKVNRI
jgi:hypothetical protein